MFGFLSGLITAGFLVSGLFFIRFWVRSREPLFLMFAAAFVLLAANQALLIVAGIEVEDQTWLYLLRLLAFVLILWGIWQKNRSR
ncbi:MAG: hypothetical protein KME20_27925 [Kaiparowitsia implicata GSE-PSE-MK54-09C]|nr:hypothetical protein [Kaiparowitsia implicata GSE-PSE-MK54-09C]